MARSFRESGGGVSAILPTKALPSRNNCNSVIVSDRAAAPLPLQMAANRPRSRRLAYRHRPVPSHSNTFARFLGGSRTSTSPRRSDHGSSPGAPAPRGPQIPCACPRASRTQRRAPPAWRTSAQLPQQPEQVLNAQTLGAIPARRHQRQGLRAQRRGARRAAATITGRNALTDPSLSSAAAAPRNQPRAVPHDKPRSPNTLISCAPPAR